MDGCNEFTTAPGAEAGSCSIAATGAPQTWADVECSVTMPAGIHDTCLSFSGAPGVGLFDIDYFSFE